MGADGNTQHTLAAVDGFIGIGQLSGLVQL